MNSPEKILRIKLKGISPGKFKIVNESKTEKNGIRECSVRLQKIQVSEEDLRSYRAKYLENQVKPENEKKKSKIRRRCDSVLTPHKESSQKKSSQPAKKVDSSVKNQKKRDNKKRLIVDSDSETDEEKKVTPKKKKHVSTSSSKSTKVEKKSPKLAAPNRTKTDTKNGNNDNHEKKTTPKSKNQMSKKNEKSSQLNINQKLVASNRIPETDTKQGVINSDSEVIDSRKKPQKNKKWRAPKEEVQGPEGDIFKIVYGDCEANLRQKMQKIPKIKRKSPKIDSEVENNFEFGNKKPKYAEIFDVGQKDSYDNPQVPVTHHKSKPISSLLDVSFGNHRSPVAQKVYPIQPPPENQTYPTRSDHRSRSSNHINSVPMETKTSKFDRFNKNSDDSSDEDTLFIDEKPQCSDDDETEIPEHHVDSKADLTDSNPTVKSEILNNDTEDFVGAESSNIPISTNDLVKHPATTFKCIITSKDEPEKTIKSEKPLEVLKSQSPPSDLKDSGESMTGRKSRMEDHKKCKNEIVVKKPKKSKVKEVQDSDDCLSIFNSDSDSFDDIEEDPKLTGKNSLQNAKKVTLTSRERGCKISENPNPVLIHPMKQRISVAPTMQERITVTAIGNRRFFKGPEIKNEKPQSEPANGNPVHSQLLPPVIHADLTNVRNEIPVEPKPLFAPPIRRISPQVRPIHLMSPNIAIQRTIGLFDNICERLLENVCANPNCFEIHDLPTEPVVEEFLKNAGADALDSYDKFVRRYKKLFQRYFRIYADFFGQQKLKHRLKDTIRDCERHKLIGYWPFVFDGLKKADVTPSDAINIFLKNHEDRTFAAVDKILEFISSGPIETVQFIANIRKYAFDTPQYKVPVHILNQFIRTAISFRPLDIICFVLEYLVRADVAISQIDESELAQFFTLCHQILVSQVPFRAMLSSVYQKFGLDL